MPLYHLCLAEIEGISGVTFHMKEPVFQNKFQVPSMRLRLERNGTWAVIKTQLCYEAQHFLLNSDHHAHVWDSQLKPIYHRFVMIVMKRATMRFVVVFFAGVKSTVSIFANCTK